MKLTHCLLICSLLMCCNAFAQQNTTNDSNSFNEMDSPSKALEEGEMNILFSYYDQDGEHSPVTGGIGTEALQDYTSTIIVNLPLNEKSRLNVMTGFDFYSSASTDNIDTRVSSASSSDSRVYFNVGYTRLVPDKNKSFGVSLGASHEYDVNSVQVGLNFSKASKDNNRELSLAAQAYFDSWSLIYPSELRRQGALLNTNLRQSYNLSATYSQVINKRMQIAFNPEVVYQSGLLSTPFHRVYFQEQSQAKVEQLPGTRLKIPLGVRFNYYLSDNILLRTYYRFYTDDWGVTGHTASIEVPFKINRFFSIYPHYRYHTQTAADYFKPHKQHVLSETFYTSDYDLSAFSSQQYGFGVHYSPLNGIGRMKVPTLGKKPPKLLLFKSIDLRGTLYDRSDGLKAWLLSLDMAFTF